MSASELPEDIVRVLRIIEYTGPRSVVEECVARSIQGEKRVSHGPQGELVIRAATIGVYPEILSQPTTSFAGDPTASEKIYTIGWLDNAGIYWTDGPTPDLVRLLENSPACDDVETEGRIAHIYESAPDGTDSRMAYVWNEDGDGWVPL